MKKFFSIILWTILFLIIIAIVSLIVYLLNNGFTFDGSTFVPNSSASGNSSIGGSTNEYLGAVILEINEGTSMVF